MRLKEDPRKAIRDACQWAHKHQIQRLTAIAGCDDLNITVHHSEHET